MPFTITRNVAQYGGSDWSNFIKTVPNCTPQSAQRIARADPNIGFFFYCRGVLVLDGHPRFNPGDAVFFSGAPWPGSAPQADIYQKDVFTLAYVGVSTNSLANAGCYTLADERQFFDFVAVFAANLDGPPNVPVLSFTLPVNATLYDTDDVKKLQSLGITVLLTVVNNWSNAGWSEFTDQKAAQGFVDQLVAAVNRFGFRRHRHRRRILNRDADERVPRHGDDAPAPGAAGQDRLEGAVPGHPVFRAGLERPHAYRQPHLRLGDELLRFGLCGTPPTLRRRRHGQEPARDRRRYWPHRRPRRGELRPAERIRRHHGVQRDEGFDELPLRHLERPLRPEYGRKAGLPRLTAGGATRKRPVADHGPWKRLQPDAAPSTLAGSTFTPGPMVEEMAIRS